MLIERIRKDSLEARKARDTQRATLLTTLSSEASVVGKNDGNREPTDSEVTAVIKKFIKGVDEVLKVVEQDQTGVLAQTLAAAVREKEILQSYLPLQLTEEALRHAIAATNEPLEVKSTGKIMKALNAQYPGQIDGALVSKIIKESVTA